MDDERVFDATPEELDLEDNDQIDVFRGNPWNYSSDSSTDDQSYENSEENEDDEDIQKEEATANASGSEAAASENGKGIVMASEVTSKEDQDSEISGKMTIFVEMLDRTWLYEWTIDTVESAKKDIYRKRKTLLFSNNVSFFMGNACRVTNWPKLWFCKL